MHAMIFRKSLPAQFDKDKTELDNNRTNLTKRLTQQSHVCIPAGTKRCSKKSLLQLCLYTFMHLLLSDSVHMLESVARTHDCDIADMTGLAGLLKDWMHLHQVLIGSEVQGLSGVSNPMVDRKCVQPVSAQTCNVQLVCVPDTCDSLHMHACPC